MINKTQLMLCAFFAGALLLSGILRLSEYTPNLLSPYAGLATPLYIGATVLCTIALNRAGVSFRRIGFGLGLHVHHVLLGLFGVVLIQAGSEFLTPVWEALFGAGRDLSRFDGLEGSLTTLLTLLVFSWTFAAFGEEIAYRIVLMGGIRSALGDTRIAMLLALIIQVAIFGLAHAYQGPSGIAASSVNALIYGSLTIAARGAIWPAAITHGLTNTIGLVSLYLGG